MLLWSVWLEVKLQVAKSTAKCIYCHTASTNSPADKGESERFRRTKWYFKLSLCRNWSALDLHWGMKWLDCMLFWSFSKHLFVCLMHTIAQLVQAGFCMVILSPFTEFCISPK